MTSTVPELAGAVNVLLQRADQLLAIHRAGVDGWCAGCAHDGHLLFHPCAYATWARDVLRQHRPAAPMSTYISTAYQPVGLDPLELAMTQPLPERLDPEPPSATTTSRGHDYDTTQRTGASRTGPRPRRDAPSRSAYRIEVHAPRPEGRVAYTYRARASSGQLLWLVAHVDGRSRTASTRDQAVEQLIAYADSTHPPSEE